MNKNLSLEHIGIAVKDLEASKKLFQKLFNNQPYKEETVESEQVTTSFFNIGNTKIELLAATNENSVIHKYIEKRKEGMHHIALNVNDIHTEIERLKSEGFEFINDLPKQGADQKLIVFLHPKSTNGVLVELCQDL